MPTKTAEVEGITI